jgi:hypothetical protein
MLKCLRIVVIAFSLTALVLLVALWVRSYWRVVDFKLVESDDRPYVVTFHKGRVVLGGGVVPLGDSIRPSAAPRPSAVAANAVLGYFLPIGYVPCWLAAAILGLFASVPWFHLRFSLRTMLIATTLAAVGLSAIVVSN